MLLWTRVRVLTARLAEPVDGEAATAATAEEAVMAATGEEAVAIVSVEAASVTKRVSVIVD